MKFTIDDCQEHIINELRKGLKNNTLYSTSLSWANYDIAFNRCVETFLSLMQIPNPDSPDVIIRLSQNELQTNRQIKIDLENFFSEALCQLFRRGIVRPGERHGGHFSISQVRALDEGFTVTEYGKEWLIKNQENNLLPASHGKLEGIYNKYQAIFGKDYFRRAKEAVSCYFSGNYLACCVMCGAATESILLSAAFIKKNKHEILRLYKTASGRRNLEKFVFGQVSKYIQERYSKYTDLISYWRDESGHGDESEIDAHEAYIAMLTLLRYAEFMSDHWNEITNSSDKNVT